MLAPLLVAAVAIGLRAVFEGVFTFVDRPFAYDYLFWWQVVAFSRCRSRSCVGLLRARLARGAVGDLVIELERSRRRDPGSACRALGDPTLELAFWLPERRRTSMRRRGRSSFRRATARAPSHCLEHDGEPMAALVHDASLLEEPELVEAVGAAARLALENARLQAELSAQLTQVEESRAPDRRRPATTSAGGSSATSTTARSSGWSRLRSSCGRAQRAARQRPRPGRSRLLDDDGGRAPGAVGELRELARGVHPAMLTEDGLAAALESLAARTPLARRRSTSRPRSASRPRSRPPRTSSRARRWRTSSSTRTRTNGDDQRRRENGDARGRGRGRRRRRRAASTAAPACAAWPTGSRRSAGGCGSRARRAAAPRGRGDPMRVVIAEDSVLLREGLAKLLADGGFEVVAQAGDAERSTAKVRRYEPDVAIVDVRMPPTHTDEGAGAAKEIRAAAPGRRRARALAGRRGDPRARLFREPPGGFGYLLKDRVLDVDEFLDAVTRVGARRHRDRPRGRRAAPRPPRDPTTRSRS